LPNDILTLDNLIKAIGQRESSGRFDAVSDGGAVGWLGIMPEDAMRGFRRGVPTVWEVASELGFEPVDRSKESAIALLKDPEVNMGVAAPYLQELMNKYQGNTQDVLTAYNAGPDKYDRSGLDPSRLDKAEQKTYAEDVAKDYFDIFGTALPENLGVLSSPRPKSRPKGLLQ
jgi:soluble lytic murein transglycosylase-like protein